jgi:hypothetical protein
VLGEVAAVLDGEELDVAPVQDQRRRLDQRQGGTHVDLQHGTLEHLGGPRAGAGALQLREPATEPLVAGAAGRQHRHHRLGAPQLVELGLDRLGDLQGMPIG